MGVRLIAPTGKYRTVGVDLFDHTDYLVGDYDTEDQAVFIADTHNSGRSGAMDDVYYVFDDQGERVRSGQAVIDRVGVNY